MTMWKFNIDIMYSLYTPELEHLGLSCLAPRHLCLPKCSSKGSWQNTWLRMYETPCRNRYCVASMKALTENIHILKFSCISNCRSIDLKSSIPTLYERRATKFQLMYLTCSSYEKIHIINDYWYNVYCLT